MKTRFVLLLLAASLLFALTACNSPDKDANFPDPSFEAAVREAIGKPTGAITREDAAKIVDLDVKGKKIKDLTGIELCTKLESLNCVSNQLTALDVSKNTNLVWLNCSDNPLTALDVSNNTKLETLACGENHLTTLDVSKNTKLETLSCDDNRLTALDVSQNTALDILNCNNNQLTALDVSKITGLKWLFCANNKLTELDISQNTALEEIKFYGNVFKDKSAVIGLDESRTEVLKK